jgi:hypothetical protein
MTKAFALVLSVAFSNEPPKFRETSNDIIASHCRMWLFASADPEARGNDPMVLRENCFVLQGTYTIRNGKGTSRPRVCASLYSSQKVSPTTTTPGQVGAGLENYFAGVADVPKVGPISWELEQEIAKRFGQEFLDHLDHLTHWGQ